MQRIAIIVPFPNNAVEYEMQRGLTNLTISYHVYRLRYQTHQSQNENKFYNEMEASLNCLISELIALDYDKIVLMCSSLSIKLNNKNIIFINDLVYSYIKKNKMNEQLIIISPYSRKTTSEVIKNYKEKNIIFKQIFINTQKGSKNYFNFGFKLDEYLSKLNANETFYMPCTNVPICNVKSNNVISSNSILIEYLNKL